MSNLSLTKCRKLEGNVENPNDKLCRELIKGSPSRKHHDNHPSTSNRRGALLGSSFNLSFDLNNEGGSRKGPP